LLCTKYSKKFDFLFLIDDHHHQLQQIGDNIKEFNFDEFFKSAFEPKVSDDKGKGGKKIELSLDMTGFRPDQIQIHLKDHDLIVQVNINQMKFSSFKLLTNFRLNQAHPINIIQLVHISIKLLHYHQ
jgi:HSP20 family molecular chaperone IbpA